MVDAVRQQRRGERVARVSPISRDRRIGSTSGRERSMRPPARKSERRHHAGSCARRVPFGLRDVGCSPDRDRSRANASRHGVAQRVEPAPAAVRMEPALGMHALRVGAQEQVLAPRPASSSVAGIRRPGDVRLAAVAELDLGARAALGAANQQHAPPPQCATAAAPLRR